MHPAVVPVHRLWLPIAVIVLATGGVSRALLLLCQCRATPWLLLGRLHLWRRRISMWCRQVASCKSIWPLRSVSTI